MDHLTIPISSIKVLENTRTEFSKTELSELMANIRENGLLHPIGAWQENDEFIVAFGHRRLAALKKLGRRELELGNEIKVLEKPVNSEDFLILNLTENLHRQDNSPIEIGKGCQRLREMGLNISEIAVRLAIPKTRVQTALKILSRVPKDMQKEIGYVETGANRKGKISATVANRISSLRITNDQAAQVFQLAKEQELTIADINLFGYLMSEGRTLAQAQKDSKRFTIKSVKLIVNKEEEAKIEGTVQNYMREILKGQRKPNSDLIY